MTMYEIKGDWTILGYTDILAINIKHGTDTITLDFNHSQYGKQQFRSVYKKLTDALRQFGGDK